MSKRYGDWRDEALIQLQSLIIEQQKQRTQLELVLETTPRDSRYSALLVSLMKAEEDNTVKEKAAVIELNRKVDEALSQETHKFFEKTASQNIKRWKPLAQKLELDREKYKALLNDQIAKINATHGGTISGGVTEVGSSSASSSSSNSIPSSSKSKKILLTGVEKGTHVETVKKVLNSDDLDEESLRLEEDYNKKFLYYEGFNLSEAFKSHKLKVDKDWSVHELLLEDDYKTRRFAITGMDEVKNLAITNPEPEGEQESRWQHPEKQKTLIHTAPVLAPVSSIVPNSSSAGSAIRAIRGRGRDDAIKSSKDLERLDRQYHVALESLADQKCGATRWMSRQKIRLMSQTEESNVERSVMGKIIEKERKDVKMIKELLFNYVPVHVQCSDKGKGGR